MVYSFTILSATQIHLSIVCDADSSCQQLLCANFPQTALPVNRHIPVQLLLVLSTSNNCYPLLTAVFFLHAGLLCANFPQPADDDRFILLFYSHEPPHPYATFWPHFSPTCICYPLLTSMPILAIPHPCHLMSDFFSSV